MREQSAGDCASTMVGLAVGPTKGKEQLTLCDSDSADKSNELDAREHDVVDGLIDKY